MASLFTQQELDKFDECLRQLRSCDACDDGGEDIAVSMIQEMTTRLRSKYKSPSATIRAYLARWGYQEAYLAKVLNSRSRASEILNGKRNLSLKDLRLLRDNLGIPVDLLLDDPKAASSDVDYSRFPVCEMYKLGLIDRRVTRRNPAKAREVVSAFFEKSGFTVELAKQACFRQSVRKNEKSDLFALQVWLAAVRLVAQTRTCETYHGISTEDLKAVARLSVFADGPVRAVHFLQELGVKLVIVPHLRGTYLDGAVFFIEESPVVALTLRYDRVDNFWHTLLHELSHLHLNHVKQDPIFDDLEILVQSGIEREADETAQAAFIPQADWERFLENRVSAMSVCAFAAEKSISPAIVAGRWRFEKKNYKTFTGLIGNGEIRCLFPEYKASDGKSHE